MLAVKKAVRTLYDIFPILNRPMALCAFLSCVAVFYLYFNSDVSLSLLVLFSIVCVVLCVITKKSKIIVISVLLLAVCASTVNEFMRVSDLEALDGRYLNADFIAIEDSEANGKVTRVTAYCHNSAEIPENSKFELYYYHKTEIKCGDYFNARVRLNKLEYDQYRADKFGRSVYMNCKILKINEKYQKEPFFAALGGVRNYIKETINNNFSQDDAALLIALNTGDKSVLNDNFYEKVHTCGVSHIMVVSGLHISIILGTVFFLLEKVFYNKYLKVLLSLIFLFLLCAVCGFTLSVLRAACMFLFSAISPLFMRKNEPLNSLGSAVVVLVFISPLCVFNVGFWLSVTATAAVVWVAPFYSKLVTEKLRIDNVVLKAIVSIINVSVAAMIFTAPISLVVFGYVSLLSPFTFLLLTYPVTFALVLDSAAFLLSLCGISYVSMPLFFVSGLCAKYIRYVIEFFGSFDFMCIKADIGTFLVFVVLAIILLAVMYQYKFYQKLLRRKFIGEVYANACNNGKPIKTKSAKR